MFLKALNPEIGGSGAWLQATAAPRTGFEIEAGVILLQIRFLSINRSNGYPQSVVEQHGSSGSSIVADCLKNEHG